MSEQEPLALSLMYVHDAAQAPPDARAENEFCHNCRYFRPTGQDPEWAPCDIFGGREVAANGWCNVWLVREE